MLGKTASGLFWLNRYLERADLPLDMVAIERDGLAIAHAQRIERNDPYFNDISARWSHWLREGMHQLPAFTFAADQRG